MMPGKCPRKGPAVHPAERAHIFPHHRSTRTADALPHLGHGCPELIAPDKCKIDKFPVTIVFIAEGTNQKVD